MNYSSQPHGGGFLSSIPPIVKNLLIINFLVFLATQVFEGPMYQYLALYYPESPLFMPHQLFTYMFMHGNFGHIFFNMYALWIFGSPLEQRIGSKRFLTYYIITGVGAALVYILVQWIQLHGIESSMAPAVLEEAKNFMNQPGFAKEVANLHAQSLGYTNEWLSMMATPMVGASGAIFGVLLAFGMLFPNTVLFLLFPPMKIKAKYFVILYGIVELVWGVYQPGDTVAHFAHVGGMLFGIILILLWRRKEKRSNQFRY